jgi:hypothetical protein
MRVVVRTTTESSTDSTPADTSTADTSASASGGAGSTSSGPSGNPAPPIGDGTGTGGSGAGGTTAVADAAGTESRPSRVSTGPSLTCHGYSEGQHGLKLTDENGEQCGYVPYEQLLRVVPE